MELWGEGFGLFDILRLKKPVDRKNSNYEAIIQYYIEPESQILIYRIPQCEMNTNAGISEEQNNPALQPKAPRRGFLYNHFTKFKHFAHHFLGFSIPLPR